MTHLLVVVTLLVVMKMGIRYYIWCIVYHMMYYNIQNLARWMQVKVDCGRARGALVVKLGELELSWSQQMRTCSEAKGWTRLIVEYMGNDWGRGGMWKEGF